MLFWQQQSEEPHAPNPSVSNHAPLNSLFGFITRGSKTRKVRAQHREHQEAQHGTFHRSLTGEQDLETGSCAVATGEKGGHFRVSGGVSQQVACSVGEHHEQNNKRDGMDKLSVQTMLWFVNLEHRRDGPQPAGEEEQRHQPSLLFHQHDAQQQLAPFGRGGRPKDERPEQPL